MKYAALNRTHPDYDAARIDRHHDLFVGGDAFRAHVDRYLPRGGAEPLAVYKERCAKAQYLNYLGRSFRWFVAALFQSPLSFTSEPETTDPFWTTLKEDCDGQGTDLDVFLSQAFLDALVHRFAWWRVEFPVDLPPDATLADADEMDARRAVLRRVPIGDLINWRCDERGRLVWLLERSVRVELLDIGDDHATTTETWTQWREDGTVRRWELAWTKDRPKPNTDVSEVEPPPNRLGKIPFACIELPEALHLGAMAAEPQIAHFRNEAAATWAIDRACYVMPWFRLKNARKPPVMGTGYFGILGLDEDVFYPEVPSAPFAILSERGQMLVTELHRIVEQMALSVDNNAAAAVGRSGESKSADAAATQVVLPAFGRYVRAAVEVTFDMIAEGRGEALDWSVGGMDRYTVEATGSLVDTALAAEPLTIPSVTHRRELFKQLSRGMLPAVTETVRKQIEREIDAGTNPEDMPHRESTIPPPGEKPGPESSVPPPGGSIPPPDVKIPKAPRVPKV